MPLIAETFAYFKGYCNFVMPRFHTLRVSMHSLAGLILNRITRLSAYVLHNFGPECWQAIQRCLVVCSQRMMSDIAFFDGMSKSCLCAETNHLSAMSGIGITYSYWFAISYSDLPQWLIQWEHVKSLDLRSRLATTLVVRSMWSREIWTYRIAREHQTSRWRPSWTVSRHEH
jgi:hypothetical protein